MPCFNGGVYLREAVDSVLCQSYPNVELIVIDDGSTDNSLDILAEYDTRITVIKQQNQGPYPARNKGLEHCHGEYIAFLDADDYWREDCLQRLFDAVDCSGAVLAYCGWQNVGLPGPRGEPHIPPDYENKGKLESFLRAAAPWPIHAALVKKSAVDNAGGFDEDLFSCMDYDLWLRVGVPNKVVLVPEVLAFYRHHDSGQITSKQWVQAKNSWLVKKKFIGDFPGLISAIPKDKLRRWVDGGLLKRGYDAYWHRDLFSAQKIFRVAFFSGGWVAGDLKYILPSLLPWPLYKALFEMFDRQD